MSYHPTVQEQHILHLQERLKAKEEECTLLAAHNRKLEAALRPFAEAYSPPEGILFPVGGIAAHHFARAAELVMVEVSCERLDHAPQPDQGPR